MAEVRGYKWGEYTPISQVNLPHGLSRSEMMGMRNTGMSNSAIARALEVPSWKVSKLIGKTPNEVRAAVASKALEKARKARYDGEERIDGRALRALRRAAGIRQNEAGMLVGVDDSTIRAYESGKARMRKADFDVLKAEYEKKTTKQPTKEEKPSGSLVRTYEIVTLRGDLAQYTISQPKQCIELSLIGTEHKNESSVTLTFQEVEPLIEEMINVVGELDHLKA